MLTRFWFSPHWEAYERATHDAPGTRARLLAASTWQTRVVDLRADEPTLWAAVRGSYHALVNRLERDEAFSIREALPTEVLDVARPLHAAAAGRATRSEASWRLQASWVLARLARCWIARRDGVPVGFVYVVVSDGCAYYFSAATHKPNVTHALIWHAMRALKASGVHFFELGWQGEAQDDKGKAIEFFRSGFGGVDVCLREVYGCDRVAGTR